MTAPRMPTRRSLRVSSQAAELRIVERENINSYRFAQKLFQNQAQAIYRAKFKLQLVKPCAYAVKIVHVTQVLAYEVFGGAIFEAGNPTL